MTAEAILARIAAEGLQVNNCFQLDTGAWRAHLRRPGVDLPVGYAAGATMAEALQTALSDALMVVPMKRPAEARQMPLPMPVEDVFA